ncbi:AlbA family DNA-binding domain-containing protein [Flavobacterium xinjiangense]|uniref:Putative DNA-binding domain-containing protein n=1 Tax=Flavobacterium xinjiangense TaxID=178356 RepID=A0A1M7H2L4_9FLAO|nr:ATP-binding protein [Flavobacterium xinjiangense]SHM22678.1 Putative DNA-binding domain-containing protein [Flavobacterium xinjiangense]
MSEHVIRLNKVLRELNISLYTACDFLKRRNIIIVANPNTKIDEHIYNLLAKQFNAEYYRKKHILLELDSKKPSVTSNSISKIMINSHRAFTVLEQKERSTILKDCLTHTTYPYRKISKLVGDYVKMQVTSLEDPEKPKFSYSVLNDFIENKEYDFDIVEKKENGFRIENSEDFTSFIPLSFERYIENGKKIKLTVEKIDLEKNQLKFKSFEVKKQETGRSQYPINNINPENIFSQGEKYVFNVNGFRIIDENTSILLVENLGFSATVKAFDFQNENNLPEKVTCLVSQVLENKIYLQQDRFSIFSELYKEGKSYNFTILSLENDYKTNAQYYLLVDNYGFNHKLYYHEFDSSGFDTIKIESQQSLYLRKIDEKGHLVLNLNTLSSLGVFVTVYSVFESINQSDNVNKYFFDLKEELKKSIYKEQPFAQLFEDYTNKENLWVFSYLSFLDASIQNYVKENKLEKALEFNKIYIAIEEWMLEGSDFLQKFSPEKKQNIIIKAEDQLVKAKAREEALNLILEEKSESYIQEVLKTLRLSGHLRGNKINVFKYIIFSSKDSINKKTSEIIEIVLLLIKGDIMDTYDINNFLDLLQKRIYFESYELNHNFIRNKIDNFNDDAKLGILNIVKVLGLQILLFQKSNSNQKAVTKSAIMCRYLSFLTEDISTKKMFLNKAINCITSNVQIELSPEMITKFDLNNYTQSFKDSIKPFLSKYYSGKLIYSLNGAIYSSINGWTLLSRQQFSNLHSKKEINLNSLATFFNNKIAVASPFDLKLKLQNTDSIEECNTNWQNYYSITEDQHKKVSHRNGKDILGMNVSVIAKNYLKGNYNILFLKISDSALEGEGILPINEVTNIHFEGLNDIINPGDEFNAEIINITEKGISFSIADEVWKQTVKEVNEGDLVDAKVLNISGNNIFIITENGHYAHIKKDINTNTIEERKVYKFKIESLNYNEKKLNLIFLANSERIFNEKVILRTFFERTNIIKITETIDDENNNFNYSQLIYELILCIESLMIFEIDNIKKMENFELLKLLASISRNNKSYYFDAHINYLLNINKFKNADYKTNNLQFDLIDEKTTMLFKNLEQINGIYKYLNYYNQPDNFDELNQLRKDEKDEGNIKLIKMLLAHNLLLSENPDEIILQRTKDLIYEYLSNEKVNTFNNIISPIQNEEYIEIEKEIEKEVEEVQIELTNLGKEGTYREFKTSFLYYAGSNTIDIEKQSFIIVKTIAGFLNAKGGSLFLGVNDKGDIIGLENEYKHFGSSANHDKYEREIRSAIVNLFNKDVNSQIEFKFHRSNNIEYCEIIIPEYEKPIPLQNNFYQRQGNETRIITGHDLVLFFERKLQANLVLDRLTFNINKESNNGKNIKLYPLVEQPLELDLFQENLDFYVDQKSANDQLIIDYNSKTPKILAHLYIFINGKYLLNREKLIDFKGAEEIVIYDNMRKGFLLQCYDNGCVNKVEVRTLLDKTFNFPYSGAFSPEGNLIGLFLIKEDCLIQVNTTRNQIQYVKLYKTIDITTHSHLKLKGNNIVQEDYDKLDNYKIIDNFHKDKLSRVTYSSKQSLGVKVDNTSYKEEIKYLNLL